MCLFGQLKVGLRQGHVIRSSRSDVAGQKLLLMLTVITWCLQKICAHATCPMKPSQLNSELRASCRRNEIWGKNVWHDFKSVRTKKGMCHNYIVYMYVRENFRYVLMCIYVPSDSFSASSVRDTSLLQLPQYVRNLTFVAAIRPCYMTPGLVKSP